MVNRPKPNDQLPDARCIKLLLEEKAALEGQLLRQAEEAQQVSGGGAADKGCACSGQ